LALSAWDAGWPRSLSMLRANFLCLPLAHSEVLEHHVRNLELAEFVTERAPAWFGDFATIPMAQARKYHELIARFGRFPHRNAMLNRESTSEEREWLESGGAERMPPDLLQRLHARHSGSGVDGSR
jgi:uncharacterized protein (DUF924 family)